MGIYSREYSREMKIYVHAELYINVHSSFIYNKPKLESLNKLWYIRTMEILLSNENYLYTQLEWILRILKKKPILEGYILSESIYVTFLK